MRRAIQRTIAMLRGGRADAELSRELASHRALLEEDFVRRGLAPEEARAAAQRALGSAAYTADLHRDARSYVWIDDARRDVHYALRALRREPGFTLVVVLTLALGIGANTAIFSVVHSVLLRPLPYKDSGRLARVWENVPGAEIGNGKGPDRRYGGIDVADLLAFGARARTVTAVAAYGLVRATAVVGGDASRLDGYAVSSGYFSMLGATPLVGRTIDADDTVPGRDRVIVLAYDAWERFGADPNALGRTLIFTGDPANPLSRSVALDVPYTIVGVMPRGFRFPYENAEFWVPRPLAASPTGRVQRVETIVRLAPGAAPAAAADEFAAVRRELRGAQAAAGGPRYELVPLQDVVTGPVKPALIVLTVAVGLVLLIACVNVANLLLARTAAREREIAVRAAIGAGPGRLVRQLLTESLLLAFLGGGAGTALAFAGVRVFRALGTTLARADLGIAPAFPRLSEISVDASVLGYAIAITVGTAIVFGLAPAVRHARQRRTDVLRETTASARTRIGAGLAVAEIALAILLLVGAGLMINSFVRLASIDPGFEPSHLLTFQIGWTGSQRQEQLRDRAEQFVERLRATPAVESAAYARQLPLVQIEDTLTLTLRRNDGEQSLGEGADVRFVSRDYLQTMAIRLVSGRLFLEADGAGRPGVMLINEAFARRAFAGASPLGAILLFGPPGHRLPFEIVGVVGNVRQFGLDRAPAPQFFIDVRQAPTDPVFRAPPLFPVGVYYTVRAAADTATVVNVVRALARQTDPRATVDDIATMEQIVSNSITRPRMYAVLVGIFASIAFALAVVGLYGVMAYSVAQRTREIGVRVALGAVRRDVMRLVLRRSIALTAAGVALGLLGAAGLTRYLESLLFGLRPLDPATFAGVSVAFAAVAMAASYVPARRAANVDPLVALRHE